MRVARLSIIIPCYNEQKTISQIVHEVLAVNLGATEKEIIIVDDVSTDGTRPVIKKLAKEEPRVKVLFQDKNRGKGAALRAGIAASSGDVVVVQDADREYDPKDFIRMLKLFKDSRADIVFGSRFAGGMLPRRVVYLSNRLANKFMTRLSAVLNGLYVSDIHTCYIMFNGDWIRQVAPRLKSNRFGFNPEIVAKIAKQKETLRICEVGISYFGRSKAEGKKIRWTDGIAAIKDIIVCNLFRA